MAISKALSDVGKGAYPLEGRVYIRAHPLSLPAIGAAQEWQRLEFLEKRDGPKATLEFARRTYSKYLECLLLKRHVLDVRGEHKARPHHATFREYRPLFVGSCLVLREYIRKQTRVYGSATRVELSATSYQG